MKKWVCILYKTESPNTSTSHLYMNFSYAEKIKNNIYDCYHKDFEINFQANIDGFDSLTQNKIKPSEWYAPEIKNIPINHRYAFILKAINKILKTKPLTPIEIINTLNCRIALNCEAHKDNLLYYQYDTISCINNNNYIKDLLKNPLEKQKLINIS